MFRRLATLASLATLVTAATVAATASSAAAAPTGCTVTNGYNWAQSLCTGGTGEHQAYMLQKHIMPEIGYIPCPGNWAPVGQYSYAQCASHQIVLVTVYTRG